MNFLHYTALQTAPYNRKDPLKPLLDIYGSIENLIKHGFEDVLKEAIGKEPTNISDDSNIPKYFAMLNEIIPCCSFEVLDEAFPYKQYSKVQIQKSIIERLISKLFRIIMNVFIYVYQHLYEDKNLPLILSVVLRTIYNADEVTFVCSFLQINRLIRALVWNPNTYKYAGHKMNSNSLIMYILIPIVERSQSFKYDDFFEPELLKHLRLCLTRNCYGNFSLRKKLKEWYDKHNVDKVLKNKIPSWKPLFEANQKFQALDVIEALTLLQELIDHGLDLFAFLIMPNNILGLLKKILTSSDGSEINIKTFLTIFLEFRTQPGRQYTWNDKSFMKLVKMMERSFGYLSQLLFGKLEMADFDESQTSIIDDMFTIFHIIQALYTLNESWSHWFDIVDAPVISDELSQICIASDYFNRLDKSISDDKTLLEMISICPDIMPQITIVSALERFVRRKKSHKPFTIRRDHILADIHKLFKSKTNDSFSKKWYFNFKHEEGRGHGPTKEAYSLVSQKIQSMDLNLWDEDMVSTCISDDSHTYEVEGLFPKRSSENLETFNFIGKLLAKALLDGRLLDIPLSDEFFSHLCKPRHTFLRKKYFDIPKIFPKTKELVRQLITIKKNKAIIQSEPTYTDSKKREIIKNLRLEDGNNFDDLCLNFTVPGTNIELREGGKDVLLSPFNVEEYLNELSDVQCDSSEEIEAVRNGFEQLLPGILNKITPKCLKSMICGEKISNWSITKLKSICNLEGYDLDSEPVEFLFQVIASFDQNEQRTFLSFVTGRTNLPLNGTRIIIKKIDVPIPDERLPSAFTCVNTLFLPSYSSLQVTREKISYAIEEGRNFGLV